MYSIVTFEDDNDVAVVSTSWLRKDSTECYWPPYSVLSKVEKAAKVHESVDDKWTLFRISKVNITNGMYLFNLI